MKTLATLSTINEARRNERGAALLSTLLLSTLLLAVGGALVLTSGMSATTAIDSTAELQAYYGAEAGLQRALDVLRGNDAPDLTSLPATAKIGFRAANTRRTSSTASATTIVASNKINDLGEPRLSAWLDYGANGRISIGNNVSFSLQISDPDDPDRTKLANAAYQPRRLLIQSTGFGPRGATKRMEMLVQKVSFDFEEQAMLLMRGADSGSAMSTFDIGNSNAKYYTGHDNGGHKPTLPTFAVTSSGDEAKVDDSITKGSTVQSPRTQLLDMDTLPSWLQTTDGPDGARAFLNEMQAVARSSNRYFTNFSGYAGSTSAPAFTFVDGTCNLDGGAGLLIVTGNLNMNGNPNFDGIILVLGSGRVNRNGGGNGTVSGAMVVAKFDRTWPASQNNQPHPFLAPHFNTNGGGNSNMLYNSISVQNARNVLGDVVRDVREY